MVQRDSRGRFVASGGGRGGKSPVRLEVRPDFDAYLKKLRGSTNKATLNNALLALMRRQSLRIAGQISRDVSGGKSGLRNRTGSLARSITGRAGLFRGSPAIQVGVFRGPALRYAAVQEFGTKGANPASPIPTIRPRRAKALAVPVEGGPALTPAGVPRYTTPRDFPGGLRFNPNVGRTNRDVVGGLVTINDGTLAYLLLRKADIKPKHFLRDGFTEALPQVVRELTDFFRKIVAGGRG